MDRLEVMQAYVRLVELGSFSAVAAELRVQQSTISKWIAALEEELGATLVERTTRQRRVTEAGQLCYDRARELLAGYEDLQASISARGGGDLEGRLRVSVPVVFGRLFVLPLCAAFMERHRRLEVELIFDDRYVKLLEGGFDVAVRVGRPLDSSYRARQLAETDRVLVCAPGYLEGRRRPRRPSDLEAHECLRHSGLDTPAIWQFRRAGKDQRATVRGRFAANNSEAVLELAREGLGVALLARWLVAPSLADGSLVALLRGYRAPPAPIQALLPPSGHLHPRVRAFVEHLAEELPRRVAATPGAGETRSA